MTGERCSSCGVAIAGGDSGCRARFDELLARDFSDPSRYTTHRMAVDAYSLQHPQAYCASARSFAAHFTGLYCAFERGGRMEELQRLQRWLSETRDLEKPELPAKRGDLTIGDLPIEGGRIELDAAIRSWARSAWDAYAPLHPLAAKWTDEAYAGR